MRRSILRRLAVSGALVAGVACGSADAPEPMLSSGLPRATLLTSAWWMRGWHAFARPCSVCRRPPGGGCHDDGGPAGTGCALDAVGLRDLATNDPLEPDDLFRVYSMTKPVTSVAAMILVEQGKVSLDDPVSKFIPEFADVTVLTDADERVEPSRPDHCRTPHDPHVRTDVWLLRRLAGGPSVSRVGCVHSGHEPRRPGHAGRRSAAARISWRTLELQHVNRCIGPRRRGGKRATVRRVSAHADSSSRSKWRTRASGSRWRSKAGSPPTTRDRTTSFVWSTHRRKDNMRNRPPGSRAEVGWYPPRPTTSALRKCFSTRVSWITRESWPLKRCS